MTSAPSLRSRREFLRRSAALPLLFAGAGCRSSREPTATRRAEVLVVGAGLSGLLAARELLRAGRRVRVLEASSGIGGRVLTLRGGLPEGLRTEAGAERVPRGHLGVRALLDEYGISTCTYVRHGGTMAIARNGEERRVRGFDELPESWFEGLNDFERGAAPLGLAQAYCSTSPLPDPADPRDARHWLRDLGASAEAVDLVDAYGPIPLRRIGAHAFAVATLRDAEAHDAELIEGGSDRLTRALAAEVEELGGEIHFGRRVVSVLSSHSDTVALRTDAGEVDTARGVVLALPAPVLAKMELDPAIAAPLETALSAVDYAHERKTHATVSVEDLREGTEVSFGLSDEGPRMQWCLPELVDGLCVRQEMGFGVRASETMRGAPGHDFGADPYYGCTYTFARPGGVPPRGPIGAGPVVVAGSDLSDWSGWMEGAVIAAYDAVAWLEPTLARGASTARG